VIPLLVFWVNDKNRTEIVKQCNENKNESAVLLLLPGHLSQHAKAATAEGLTFSDPMHKKVREIQICTIFVILPKN
jgi:hypothetical protein